MRDWLICLQINVSAAEANMFFLWDNPDNSWAQRSDGFKIQCGHVYMPGPGDRGRDLKNGQWAQQTLVFDVLGHLMKCMTSAQIRVSANLSSTGLSGPPSWGLCGKMRTHGSLEKTQEGPKMGRQIKEDHQMIWVWLPL